MIIQPVTRETRKAFWKYRESIKNLLKDADLYNLQTKKAIALEYIFNSSIMTSIIPEHFVMLGIYVGNKKLIKLIDDKNVQIIVNSSIPIFNACVYALYKLYNEENNNSNRIDEKIKHLFHLDDFNYRKIITFFKEAEQLGDGFTFWYDILNAIIDDVFSIYKKYEKTDY